MIARTTFTRFCNRCLTVCCVAILLSTTGCAGLLNPGPAPKRMQLLPAMPAQTAMIKGKAKQLTVAMPVTSNDLDTDSIALVFNTREVRYLAGVKWTSSVPQIMQQKLIEALEATQALPGVTDESAGVSSDAKLVCDIRQFSLHYSAEKTAPTAIIQATFKLVNLHNGSIVGTLPVTASVPTANTSTEALIAACEKALEQTLATVTPWALTTMQKISW